MRRSTELLETIKGSTRRRDAKTIRAKARAELRELHQPGRNAAYDAAFKAMSADLGRPARLLQRRLDQWAGDREFPSSRVKLTLHRAGQDESKADVVLELVPPVPPCYRNELHPALSRWMQHALRVTFPGLASEPNPIKVSAYLRTF
jgi:hypothetical protein